jgi:heat-inducible transcriptional repressor
VAGLRLPLGPALRLLPVDCVYSVGCVIKHPSFRTLRSICAMLEKSTSTDLNERSRSLLRALIKEHVRTGKPVGSRRLAKIDRQGLSAATIRNVMADLEEQGLVTHPHTSAGRVPTDKGYRFYVDSMLHARGLTDREEERIKQSLEKETVPEELMNKASQILSTVSSNLGFVVTPPLSQSVMKHIDFVRISTRRIMVILVTQAAQVQHRMIQLGEDLSQAELDQAAHYLVEHFEGSTLRQIRDELLKMMSEEKALYDRMLKNVLLLGSAGILQNPAEDEEDDSEVYLAGTSQIIKKPELAHISHMVILFQTFEEKSRLVRIISECLKSDGPGPIVTIGLDKHLPGMRDWALVSSPYAYYKGTGVLGILGPSRMEYEKAVGLVDYMAKLFGKILSRD